MRQETTPSVDRCAACFFISIESTAAVGQVFAFRKSLDEVESAVPSVVVVVVPLNVLLSLDRNVNQRDALRSMLYGRPTCNGGS